MTARMRKRVNRALADRDLQTALPTFTLITKLARQIGMEGIDFAALRDEVRRVKEKSIADLPRLIERFKAQAAEAGHSVQNELALLAVHGTLHLLGHDHTTPQEKAAMWAIQNAILASLNLKIER